MLRCSGMGAASSSPPAPQVHLNPPTQFTLADAALQWCRARFCPQTNSHLFLYISHSDAALQWCGRPRGGQRRMGHQHGDAGDQCRDQAVRRRPEAAQKLGVTCDERLRAPSASAHQLDHCMGLMDLHASTQPLCSCNEAAGSCPAAGGCSVVPSLKRAAPYWLADCRPASADCCKLRQLLVSREWLRQ